MKRGFFTSLATAAAVTASIVLVSGAAAAAPDATAATTASAQSAGVTPNAQLPADNIKVDETQFKIVASLLGVGKQVYDCNTAGTYAPRPEPIAALFTSRGIPAGIHGKGPFWANSDGSHVDGSAPVSAPSPDPTKNIPWLKLVGTPTPNTTGVFSNVAFIQRIDTRGGVAPTDTCTSPDAKAVGYTANYVFWAHK